MISRKVRIMNRKLIFIKRYTALLLLAAMVFSITGCVFSNYSKDKYPKVNGIDYLKFISATGKGVHTNCLSISNDYGRYETMESNYFLLTGDTAKKLIDEITALPDVYGDETEPLAYSIYLSYYDENVECIRVYKDGYGGFPDNWHDIIEHTNEIAALENKQLTYSTNIVTIDANLLRKDFGVTDDMLPKGATVESFCSYYNFTYEDMYDKYFNREYYVSDYAYNYYGFKSYRLTKSTVAKASDSDSLKEYARANLDNISSADDISIAGSFDGHELEIVRFDSFVKWLENNEMSLSDVHEADDGALDIERYVNIHMEGMSARDVIYIYIEPTNRYLILTRFMSYPDYNLLYDFFNQ